MKNYWREIALGILLGLGGAFIFTENGYMLLGRFYHAFIESIRYLANTSFIGNMGAWIIILVISSSPLLLTYRHWKNKYILIYSSLFSILLFLVFYLSLQNFPSNYIHNGNLILFLYSNILISIIIGFIFEGIVYLIFVKKEFLDNVLSLLPNILIIYSIQSLTLVTTSLFLNSTLLLNVVYILYYSIFMLLLVPKLKTITSQKASFNELVSFMRVLKRYTKNLLYLVLLTNSFLNFIPALIFPQMDYNLELNFHLNLILGLIIILVFSTYIEKAKLVEDENRMFI